MTTQHLPLLALFIQLQKAGMPLGIDEYQQVLSALQAGFGVTNLAELKRLCRTFWVKSDEESEESRLFDYYFEQFMPQLAEPETASQPIEILSEQPETFSTSPSTSSEMPTPPRQTKNMHRVDQSLQATGADDTSKILYTHHISSDEYFPVTRRQMQQSWRYLRRPVRSGPPVELDVEATVDEIGRFGILLEPVLIPARINQVELLLLIDHDGSMVPFHMISQRLIETALRGGRMGKVDTYYFHNYPAEYLYHNVAHLDHERIEKILDGQYSQQTGVLIFSDAGAARGGFSPERVDATEKFLKRFKQQFRYISWLNPMPRSRWSGTTASKIMQNVPMFELSRQGLDDAINVLRGRPARLEYSVKEKHYE